MKFIKLESRGGNYLVVAENVAWLRNAENGQTNVGIIGSQPLLVIGSIEEVAAKILAGTAATGDEAPPVAAPELPTVAEAQRPAEPVPEPVPEPAPEPEVLEPEPAPKPAPKPATAALQAAAPVMAPASAEPEPDIAPQARTATPAAPRPRAVPRTSATLWERPAPPTASPGRIRVKAGTQRMMGALE
jgi:periplasmic protein TonB